MKYLKEVLVLLLLADVAGLYGFKSHLLHYIESMGPARNLIAEAQVEIKLQNINVGKVSIFKWRGKPIFVYHRSQSIIEQERQTDVTELRDPETDEQRVKRPEWLVIIGIYTHLGCIYQFRIPALYVVNFTVRVMDLTSTQLDVYAKDRRLPI